MDIEELRNKIENWINNDAMKRPVIPLKRLCNSTIVRKTKTRRYFESIVRSFKDYLSVVQLVICITFLM